MIPDEKLISEAFVRAPGPGGQNVNKVSSAVELRYRACDDPRLSLAQLAKLRRMAGRRMTIDDTLILQVREHRSQDANRRTARVRLTALLAQAMQQERKRRKTRPSKASKERRLQSKAKRSQTKAARKRPID